MITELRYCTRSLIRELGFLQQHYGPTQATYSETHVLVELGRLGALDVQEFSKILNVDKSVASRVLSAMYKKRWIEIVDSADLRKKPYILTKEGRKILDKVEVLANKRVANALEELSIKDREVVKNGIYLYSQALKKSRLKGQYKIRVIEKKDDKHIAKIVRKELKELGFEGPGTAATDESLDYLSQVFVGKDRIYLVADREGKICGGAGATALVGGPKKTCELVRMFIERSSRGSGLGQLLIDYILKAAKDFGYNYCYLETTEKMKSAQRLYLNNGFEYLPKRRGNTGHFACKVFMGRKL